MGEMIAALRNKRRYHFARVDEIRERRKASSDDYERAAMLAEIGDHYDEIEKLERDYQIDW